MFQAFSKGKLEEALSEIVDREEMRERFTACLSQEEFLWLVLTNMDLLENGVPSSPPEEFERFARTTLRLEKLEEILVSVEIWAKSEHGNSLHGEEREKLLFGLLWQTVLVSEFHTRFKTPVHRSSVTLEPHQRLIN